jgi:chromosome partitioning protein
MHVIDQRGGPFCQPGAVVRRMGDSDRQPSPALWLQLCQPGVRLTQGWGVSLDLIPQPPDDLTSAALDMPAGLRGWHVKDVFNLTDKVLLPMRPSIHRACTRRVFLDELAAPRRAAPRQAEPRHAARPPVAIAGMRAAGAPRCG